MTSTAVVHDHFVLLLNTDEFETLPNWLTDNFNIIEGGIHAGRSSRNKLIVFKDGTYLELFNWISKPVDFVDWADKQPGLIDFALTTLDPVTPEHNFNHVKSNLEKIPATSDLGVAYQSPQAGGRKRADGTEVKWKNSRPTFTLTQSTPDQALFPAGRIDVPFFCHDVTERAVRVPFRNDEITTHPCGAVGIFNVEVLVPETHINAYLGLYEAVLGVEKPKLFTDHHQIEAVNFRIGVPNPLDSHPAYVTVYPSRHAEDQKFLEERGIGIRSLTLRTKGQVTDSHGIGSLGNRGDMGNTIKLLG